MMVSFCAFLFPRDVMDEEPRARVGQPQTGNSPSNFIGGCRKAALLFWNFGDFRCGVLLFIDIYFPLDILDEIWDLSKFLRVFSCTLYITWPQNIFKDKLVD